MEEQVKKILEELTNDPLIEFASENSISKKFIVNQGASSVYRTNVSFSNNETSKTINSNQETHRKHRRV